MSTFVTLVANDAIVFGGAIGALFYRHYLPSYMRRKGEYRAMREDIAEVTRLQTAARAEFDERLATLRSDLDSGLETLKANLSKSVHVHRVQAELEIRVYQDIWKNMVPLDEATRRLTGANDPEAIEAATQAFRMCARRIDRWKPFYPQQVFDALDHVLGAVRLEGLDRTLVATGQSGRPTPTEIYQNRVDVLAAIGDACAAIRSRLAALTTVTSD